VGLGLMHRRETDSGLTWADADAGPTTDMRKMSRRRIDAGKPVAGHWGAAGQRTSAGGWAHVGDGTGTMVGWLGFREDGKPV
jgi:hypothetical protein